MSQSTRAESTRSDDPLVHEFKNHLSVIVGFCDLLLQQLPPGDPKRADILEMQRAGRSALALLPDLSARIR